MPKKLQILGLPPEFHGRVRLPPSKSYLHRALFVSALASGKSTLTACGYELADDVSATIDVLRAFGVNIVKSKQLHGTLEIVPGTASRRNIQVFARGSGTTARFAISFSALEPAGTRVRISGDESLTARPMKSIFESLGELGVRCAYEKKIGNLPITVEGGGIEGGQCWVDGSISSQFISSLLIACTRARKDCLIRVKNPDHLVSKPYIDATLKVLSYFGLDARRLSDYSEFKVRGNQVAKNRRFKVPGDMSAAAALIGATLAARGKCELMGVDQRFPQADGAIVPIAVKLGSKISKTPESIRISSKPVIRKQKISFDLNESPDIVPIVAGLGAAIGINVEIRNIGHLRFKESDRISVLSRELEKLGIQTKASQTSLAVLAVRNYPVESPGININPEKDHRMLMALAIAALSGRYGEILISDPGCVRKSYPDFVNDIQKLCHEKNTVRIVDVSKK